MTPQEIAIAVDSVSWIGVQSDCPMENQNVTRLLFEIEKLPPKQGLRLLMKVIELKGLRIESDISDPDNYFRTMTDFRNVDSALDCHPTDDYHNFAED